MGFWPDVKRGDKVQHHMVLENNLRHMVNSLNGFGSGMGRAAPSGVVRIQIWNATNETLPAGQPVAFDNTKPLCGDAVPAVKVTDTKKPWGVCVNTLDANSMGDCIISGPAEVTLSGGSGDYAEPVVNGTGFTRSSTGTARVLFAGEKNIIVLGGAAAAEQEGHPFDLQIINGGTEESPVWKVKVFDSLGSNNTAGIVYIGTTTLYPPAQKLSVPAGPNPSYIDLVIHYENNQYVMDFVIYTSGNNPYENNDQYCLKRIGTVSWQNNEPTAVSRIIQDIEIFGRWA